MFINSAEDFSVAEDATVGTEVALVQATDADVGEFGKITYLLDTSSTQGRFKINKETVFNPLYHYLLLIIILFKYLQLIAKNNIVTAYLCS